LLYILRSFEVRPCSATLDEWYNLKTVASVEPLVDPFDEQSLFDLQFDLCVSAPMAISMNMRWEDAGQLPMKDAIRIQETLYKRNDALVRALKDK